MRRRPPGRVSSFSSQKGNRHLYGFDESDPTRAMTLHGPTCNPPPRSGCNNSAMAELLHPERESGWSVAPAALLAERVAVHVVAVALPAAGAVLRHPLEAAQPFGR